MEIIIKNGFVFDGSGNPWVKADIGIEKGKIARVGKLKGIKVDSEIDATGLVVCPGFIDIHCHSDILLLSNPTMDAKVFQGVTTELNGNCGNSPTPLVGDMKNRRAERLNIEANWATHKEYVEALSEKGHATNSAMLQGYNQLRMAVMGMDDRKVTDRELGLMKLLLRQSLDQGVFGLSTGLWYSPSSFATTEELIELCKIVAKYDATYVTHIRSESRKFVEAIEEAIRIGEESGASVECVHHKAYGEHDWGKIPVTLDLITKARERGVDVTLDVYPYIYDSGNFEGWLPVWARTGGFVELGKRLKDPVLREKIKSEIENQIQEPEKLLSTAILTRCNSHPEYAGKKLIELAKAKKMNIIDYAIELSIEEIDSIGMGSRAIGISSKMSCEENVKRVITHPASMIGSDGSGHPMKNNKDWIHPRNFGTFPRFFGKYVRDEGVLSLQEAIRKCTSAPAQRIGLKERGLIREGMWADITIFNYHEINDNFSLEDPVQYPTGIKYVIVNGATVIDDGEHTGQLPGKSLIHGKS